MSHFLSIQISNIDKLQYIYVIIDKLYDKHFVCTLLMIRYIYIVCMDYTSIYLVNLMSVIVQSEYLAFFHPNVIVNFFVHQL